MNIYEVWLAQPDFPHVLFVRSFGIAETLEEAMRLALQAEREANRNSEGETIDLVTSSGKLIGRVDFEPPK